MFFVEEGTCGNDGKTCHSLAQCVSRGGNMICECNIGYIGDGESCKGRQETIKGNDGEYSGCAVVLHSQVFKPLPPVATFMTEGRIQS